MSAIPLTPEEAIRAMLSGETLTSAGMECRWDRDKFVFYNPRLPGIPPIPLNQFKGLYRGTDKEEDA